MDRLCLDSKIPIFVQAWRPDIQGRVGGWRSIKNSSGPNVFGALDQIKWPFPRTRKKGSCKSVNWKLSEPL